jgi:hypothetical protein
MTTDYDDEAQMIFDIFENVVRLRDLKKVVKMVIENLFTNVFKNNFAKRIAHWTSVFVKSCTRTCHTRTLTRFVGSYR